MKYYLINNDMDPNDTVKRYYVMDEATRMLIKVIDENCNECTAPPAHRIINMDPPLPPCIASLEQQP